MNPKNLPYVGAVFRFGADDRVLDSILLFGPIIVLVMVAFGRNLVTELVVGLYVLSLVGYVLYKGFRERGDG